MSKHPKHGRHDCWILTACTPKTIESVLPLGRDGSSRTWTSGEVLSGCCCLVSGKHVFASVGAFPNVEKRSGGSVCHVGGFLDSENGRHMKGHSKWIVVEVLD